MFPADERYVAAEPRPRPTRAARLPAARAPGRWPSTPHKACCRQSTWSLASSRARENDVLLRLVPQVGEYVSDGEPLFEVFPAAAVSGGPNDTQLLRAVDVGRERAVYQDPFYGIRVLVDVAAQALSPAVNAPTTAVQVLDRLAGLPASGGLSPVAERPLCRRDRCGAARHAGPQLGSVR